MAGESTMTDRNGIFFLALLLCIYNVSCTKYTPDWKSIDSRPLPQWYDDGKLGIFLHWGVFSVPSFETEWFWNRWKSGDKAVVKFMTDNYKPDFTYADFASQFTAELFNPDHWADIFAASGAKYVVLTSKHHEGFTNWPSKYSFSWNSMDVGPKRDLVGELATAVRKKADIKFGVYHSLFEFYNPLYLEDEANNYTTTRFVKFKTMPELYELVENYKPDVIWSDGDWMVDDFYWGAVDFLAWLYNESPVKDTVVVNDRWGKNIRCHHGGFFNCNDRYNPGTLQKRKWENAMTMEKSSWGYDRRGSISDYLTMEELLKELITTVSCGGNLLVNIGPTADGRLMPIFEERLISLGQWMDKNGEAIYKSHPWKFQNDTENHYVWYTKNNRTASTVVYAHLLKLPETGVLSLASPVPSVDTTTVKLLGYDKMLSWVKGEQGGIVIKNLDLPFYDIPSPYAWVFKLEGLVNA